MVGDQELAEGCPVGEAALESAGTMHEAAGKALCGSPQASDTDIPCPGNAVGGVPARVSTKVPLRECPPDVDAFALVSVGNMRNYVSKPTEPAASENLEQTYLRFIAHAATRQFSEPGSKSGDLAKTESLPDELVAITETGTMEDNQKYSEDHTAIMPH